MAPRSVAARRTRVIAALAIAPAMVAGPTVPAGAQVAEERRFPHVTVCTLPDRVSRVVAVFGVFPQPPP